MATGLKTPEQYLTEINLMRDYLVLLAEECPVVLECNEPAELYAKVRKFSWGEAVICPTFAQQATSLREAKKVWRERT